MECKLTDGGQFWFSYKEKSKGGGLKVEAVYPYSYNLQLHHRF